MKAMNLELIVDFLCVAQGLKLLSYHTILQIVHQLQSGVRHDNRTRIHVLLYKMQVSQLVS